MDLDELAVGVVRALLEDCSLCRTGADDRVGAFAENGADSASGEDDGVGRESAEFHGAQIESGDAAGRALGIDDGREEFPSPVLLALAFRLVAAELLIARVESLLLRRCALQSGA